MNEKLQRLAMHAFRGVPSEMTVDFGQGESTVVYGDNGTGKSTIADALEWYFTARSSCCRTRDASTRCAMSAATATASHRSRSSPAARSVGRSCSPTSGRLTCSTRSGARRSSFADALSRTSSTRPRPRSGRRWSRSWAWTRSRASEKTCSEPETTCARHQKPRKRKPVYTAVPCRTAPTP